MPRRVLVFGPAYLDRVLRVDRPLLDPTLGGPLDLSAEGAWIDPLRPGPVLTLADPEGGTIELEMPADWSDGFGTIALSRPLVPDSGPWRNGARCESWSDDLGGMGAGFASAIGGELVSALGPETDAPSRQIASRLAEAGIVHRPARIPDRTADWTLLVTSGPHGDKLPIGFRGCHASLDAYPGPLGESWDLLVVASLTNRLVASALGVVGATATVFAPTLRNMLDDDPPVASFADRIGVLCCNRREWEALADRESVAASVPLVAVTDGPNGSAIRVRTPAGSPMTIREPAFPRSGPPRDTNRAGEAFASTLVATLLDAGWRPGPVDEGLLRRAARRASAAAALVLDLESFGFPGAEEVDRALERGRID